MMPTHNPLIAPLIQSFFTQHLQLHKRVSPQTVACYRDTFRLLFQYIKEQTGCEPATFCVADLDAEAVLSFLNHLERQQRNSVRSRNVRLAAIRTFFRWVALREPEQINLSTRIRLLSNSVGKIEAKAQCLRRNQRGKFPGNV